MRSILPTPFHRLSALSREFGIELWCKRDDLTGFALGGNKTRKLDMLIEDALKRGATDLIAVGGVQSNFCRLAAAYAAAEGVAAHLVLGGTRLHSRVGGNLLLDEFFGARITRVDSDDWLLWERAAVEKEAGLIAEGRTPYRMPVGGSTPIGAKGYVAGFLEILKDAEAASIEIGAIVHATSSAGTHAGLLVGRALSGWDGRIIAMAVAKSEEQLRNEAAALAGTLADSLGVDIDPAGLLVDAGSLGPGYGVPTAEAQEAQLLFALREGILLDDVYTAKAAAGLLRLCREGRLPKDRAVVFLHTGGVPQMFSVLPV
ncbi:MAG: pyridoxal-phosphate dependent enzyme [Ignavibacteriae bacterium]|nr:pyridoxal-phosphate dependent enzyme [Ignavibacteriota bacterium]